MSKCIAVSGDYFINRKTGDIFVKVDGVWVLKGNVWTILQKPTG